MVKKSKSAWKTYQGVFDQFTLRQVFKLSSQGHFIELKSPISIGKESHIFSATAKEGLVIVKIHRLETSDFNRMFDYIKIDPRYLWLKKNQRKVIFAWTQREFRNLMLAREAGVSVPKPIAFKDNIVVMEFIGKGNDAAPRLKDAVPDNKKEFLAAIIRNMKKLYDADLVHGDLSSFNILNHDEKPVFIDFSQAMPMSCYQGKELLERDALNIANFFSKQGLHITGAEIINKIIIMKDINN